MQKISTKTCEDTMYCNKIPVLKYRICFPTFITTYSSAAARHINSHYLLYCRETKHYCRTVLFRQAAGAARYIPSNQPPFNSYEFESVYETTLNRAFITSLYTDRYEYLGGAHGSTFRLSDTWDFKTCARLELQQFFPSDGSYPGDIFKEIEKQIQERLKVSPSSYFDDYPILLRKNFCPENFYLDKDGIVVYYQQYDIAPYATGIPTFSIPIQANYK